MLLGLVFKGQCLAPWADGLQYERLCYNDLQPLYGIRGIEQGIFPYIHGGISETNELFGGAIEYPVLTGLFMWLAGVFATDVNSYLVISALLLAPFGLIAAYVLQVMTGRRALMWAAAPALVIYAFHNWDLLVVAAASVGFYRWYRGDRTGAAILFGAGAAIKMYPIFFLGPLVLEALARPKEDRGGLGAAVRVAVFGVGTFVLINLPFALANADGWLATYRFHSARGPNYDNIWTWLPSWAPTLDPGGVNLASAVLTGISFLGILGYGWLRLRREGTYPSLQSCAALLAAFLLWNKVHSPQYTLWLLPFFALVRISIGWWIAYSAVDVVVYVGVMRFFFDQNSEVFRRMMVSGVWLRAGLLAVLIGVFLQARSAAEPEGQVAGVREPRGEPAGSAAAGAAVG